MKRRNMIALSIFALFYLSFGLLVTIFQEKIVYYPSAQDFHTCVGFLHAEKVTHQGTRMYVYDTNKPLVVLYHGNAGSACDRDFYTGIFAQAGYGYVVVEYAGFSDDTLAPTHARIKQDARNVISYLEENNFDDITIVGESIGAGVASYHASIASPKRLLLISPFTNLADVAQNRFWFYPTSLLVDNAFDNVANLKDYSNPVMIIHGTKDNVVPFSLGERLFESLEATKEFVAIEQAGHNDIFIFEETYTSIQTFLKSE